MPRARRAIMQAGSDRDAPERPKRADSSALWEALTEAFLAHSRDTAVLINDLIAQNPEDACAHLVKGYMLLLLARAELVGPAQECLRVAAACAQDNRSRQFAAGLAAWLSGQPRGAIHAMERIIDDHPRDVLAIKLSHGIRFILGDADGMRRSLSRVISVFGDEVPYAGYIRGCYAFALEETGAYGEAEAMGRRAVMLAPRDAWGRHAVAHVLEMRGRADEGVAWLGGQEGTWAHCGNFAYHLYWHLALFQLDLGRIQDVLALYDHAIRADRTDDYRDIANAASLLERLTLAGVDVGARWEELAEVAGRRTADRRLVFADLHYILALLGAGRRTDAQGMVRALMAGGRPGHDGEVAQAIGIPLAESLLAFQAGRYGDVVRLIGPVRARLFRIGGSHAQRDLFEQIYLEALVRSGAHEQAAAALEHRLAGRNGHNLFASRLLARVAGRTGPQRVAAGVVGLLRPSLAH